MFVNGTSAQKRSRWVTLENTDWSSILLLSSNKSSMLIKPKEKVIITLPQIELNDATLHFNSIAPRCF